MKVSPVLATAINKFNSFIQMTLDHVLTIGGVVIVQDVKFEDIAILLLPDTPTSTNKSKLGE